MQMTECQYYTLEERRMLDKNNIVKRQIVVGIEIQYSQLARSAWHNLAEKKGNTSE